MYRSLVVFLMLICSTAMAQPSAKLSGTIRNTHGEYLENVKIAVKGKNHFVFSDEKGSYQILLSAKNNVIVFTLEGYKASENAVQVKSNKDIVLPVVLAKDLNILDQVTVRDNAARSQGMVTLNAKNFSSSPNVSQSFESLLKQLPGVSTNNELSSQYSVRGGNFDENLIYINDVEIFKPYLVRNGQQEGLSLINPDMAGNVKFSAGGFSAKYGDKMSSVLDVNYKKDATGAIVSLGTNGISATTFVNHKNLNVALGFRNKRNQSILKTQQVRGSYDPSFYDFQGVVNYKISPKFSAEFLGIVNKSEFGLIPESRETIFGTLQEVLRLKVDYEGQERDEYQNLVGAFTLNYRPNNNINIKWINSAFFITEKENFDIYGQYVFDEVEADFLGGSFGKVKANRGIGAYQDYGRNELNADIFASDLKVNFNTKKSFWETSIRFQQDRIKDELMEFNYLDSAGYSIPNNNNEFVLAGYRNASNQLTTNRISGYIVNTTEIGDKMSFSGGLRVNYNSFTKEFIPSPRVVFTYKPGKEKDIIYRFASGLYVQTPFYREMRNLDGHINNQVKSQKSIHFVASSDYKFKGLGTNLKFTSEAYYKSLYHLIPYELENLRIRYLADKTSKGYATGLDFSVSGEFIRSLESSFRLSLMKTQEDIDGDNEGYIKRPTDQRVNFSAFFQDRLFNSPTYKIHMNLLFGSRMPTWPPKTENYRNNFTIPAYKRLDIGFSKDILDPESEKRIKVLDKYFNSLILYAEVFNLLNINNTVSYLWITDVNNNRYAIPNYLTSRQLNFKIIAKF
jgi:uncharacterized protein YegP (UPF0339 family)